MSMLLENTTSAAVENAIRKERHRLGATATGMVLTFIIVSDELSQSEATRAATFSANQHPCRIIVVIPRPGRGKPQLDAELWVGDREGPGETVKLRLKGPLARHQASVVVPLLLPDTPVVVWWPSHPPAMPAEDPVGILAHRRITDSSTATRPVAELLVRASTYRPGDTDLAWTRTTGWRSMLATALDEPFDKIESAVLYAERNNASAQLMAGWLESKLRVPVSLKTSRGPGITAVTLNTKSGSIDFERPDGRLATISRTTGLSRKVPLPRRELRDLISEELQRLDADEIYQGALKAFAKSKTPSLLPRKKAAAAAKTAPASEKAAPTSKKATPASKK